MPGRTNYLLSVSIFLVLETNPQTFLFNSSKTAQGSTKELIRIKLWGTKTLRSSSQMLLPSHSFVPLSLV